MDIISVTSEALKSVYLTIQQLADNTEEITNQCVSELSSSINNLDSKFSVDIRRYVETVEMLQEKLKDCIEENMIALSDRFNKIPYYEACSYKQRRIG